MRKILVSIAVAASLLVGAPAATSDAASSDVNIVILGGTAAVSTDVLEHLQSCTDGTVTRIAGTDRYATAAAVSRKAFASAKVVYLAAGSSFPEAVAAGPIAALRNAPLLLTRRGSLPAETRAEIQRLGATEVILLGGTGAVSASVEADLARSHRVSRISGTDRYSTIAAISASYFQAGRAPVAYIARGDLSADSLAGGPAAVANGGPILLTGRNTLPSATAAELRRLAPAKIVILGGSVAVSAQVERALAPYTTGSVSRLAGSNRYDTAAKISTALPTGARTLYVATADDFPDALAGVPLAGTQPIFLATEQTVPGHTADRIAAITGKACPPLSPLASLAATAPAAEPDRRGVLWSDGFETGDLSRWLPPAVSGKASADIVDSPAHSGNHSLRLTNRDVDGSHSAGARMTPNTTQWRPPTSKYPDDMYYSAWYFIPVAFQGKSNAFQFKMSDATAWDSTGDPTAHTWRMIWKISFDWDKPSGEYRMEMATRVDQATGAWRSGEPDTLSVTQPLVPVGEWFHVETRYVWGKNGTGRTTVWLNGDQVWNQGNMSTEANNLECLKWCRTWAVNHYLGDWQGYVAPGDSWIIIDDARMSTTRTGTG